MLFNPMLMKKATVPITGYQVTYLQRNSSASTTISGVNFGSPQSDRELFFLIEYYEGAASLLTSVTIGGISATVEAVSAASGTNVSHIYLARANVPTGTSGSIVLTYSGSTPSTVYTFGYRVTGRPVVGAAATGAVTGFAASSSTSLTLGSLTIPSNGFAIGGLFYLSSMGTVSVSGLNLALNYSNGLQNAASSPIQTTITDTPSWSWTTAKTGPIGGVWAFS